MGRKPDNVRFGIHLFKKYFLITPSWSNTGNFYFWRTTSQDHFILLIRIWCNQILKINVVPNVNIIANKYNNEHNDNMQVFTMGQKQLNVLYMY